MNLRLLYDFVHSFAIDSPSGTVCFDLSKRGRILIVQHIFSFRSPNLKENVRGIHGEFINFQRSYGLPSTSNDGSSHSAIENQFESYT